MEEMLEDLRISFMGAVQEFMATISSPKLFDDDDDETDDLGRKVRALKKQLAQLRSKGKESQKLRRAEIKQLNHEMYEKQRNLHRLGRKAQRHISLYEYAVLMRTVQPHESTSTEKTMETERLIGKRGHGSAPPATASQPQQQPKEEPFTVTTLIKRSQTFYASSAVLWQLMVQSILQVRLLRKAHLLTMFHAQADIFKKHKSLEVQAIVGYTTSTDKLDELCIDVMQRKSHLMRQIETTQKITNELDEAYDDVVRKQRKLILRLKLRENQAVSDQVRLSLRIDIIDNSKDVVFLNELKRASLKRLSSIAERASSRMSGAVVEQVRMEFSLDEALIEEEEAAAAAEAAKQQQQPLKFSPDSSPDSSDRVGPPGTPPVRELDDDDYNDHLSNCNASSTSSMSFSDDDEFFEGVQEEEPAEAVVPAAAVPTAVPTAPPPQPGVRGKRSRAELRANLDRIASNRSLRNVVTTTSTSTAGGKGTGLDRIPLTRSRFATTSGGNDNSSVVSGRSTASRSELEHRRLQAAQRLAESKRMSQRVTMRQKREKARRRLQESKKKLQGFLAASDDEYEEEEEDDPNNASFSVVGMSSTTSLPLMSEMPSHFLSESGSSLQSPDSVTEFPYHVSSSILQHDVTTATTTTPTSTGHDGGKDL